MGVKWVINYINGSEDGNTNIIVSKNGIAGLIGGVIGAIIHSQYELYFDNANSH